MANFSIAETRDDDAIILGLGRLGMAAYPVGSPGTFTEVGYTKAISFAYSREVKDYESAGFLVKQIVFRDRLSLTADFSEVSISNFNRVIQGTVVGDNIYFGTHRNITTYAIRFEHQRTDNAIIQFNMYKSVPSGEFTFAFAEEEYVRYPVNFVAQVDDTKAAGQKYGSIKIIS